MRFSNKVQVVHVKSGGVMQNFNLKSILLGIGIGVVTTSIACMIYTAGMDVVLSKDEIIEQAKKYGMIESTALIIDKNTENSNIEEEQKEDNQEDNKEDNRIEDNGEGTSDNNSEQNDKNSEEENQWNKEIVLKVLPGDSAFKLADILLNEGLISDKKAFLNRMKELKLTDYVQVGEYKLNDKMSNDEIIKIITRRNGYLQ